MTTINTGNNANVAYNYQKVPGLVTSNLQRSEAGLTAAMRDRANTNRNTQFLFPTNYATPNFGPGAIVAPRTITSMLPDGTKYLGKQII